MEVRTNHGIKLNGFYRGKVIQHLNEGKCKIFIPGVYPDEFSNDPKKLPDAEQAAPLFGGTNKGNGTFSYPNIDSIVWCFFQNGDQNLPVYFAATLGGQLATSAPDEGFTAIRDNVSPSDTPDEDTTRNGKDSQQHMINCGDSRIVIREAGQIEIKCEDKKGKTLSQIFIDESGNIQIVASQSIQFSAPSVKIDATEQMEINTTAFIVRANNEMQINTPQLGSVNANSFTVKSPSINLDASQGKLVAKGATHSPLFLV